MITWQRSIVLFCAFAALLFFFKGFYESKFKKNAYGLVCWLLPWGVIAWGDAVIFGPFWIIASLVTIILGDWYLFLLIVSVFWVIRSLGEVVYWFNQQFSSKVYEWNKPENLPWHSIFHDDSVWYIHQIIWQCTAVGAIISSIYFTSLWLSKVL